MKQFALFPREAFPHPVPYAEKQYVPVVKTLRGELDALEQVAPAAWPHVTPLVEVMGNGADDDEPPKRSKLPRLADDLKYVLARRPFFLDFRGLSTSQKLLVGDGKNRQQVRGFEWLLAQCDAQQLNFVPVIAPASYKARSPVVKLHVNEGRGACLRLPLNRAWAQSIECQVDEMLQSVELSPSETDLALDLEYIRPEPGFEAKDLLPTIDRLARMGCWRSFILLGTVIPETLARFPEREVTAISRHEWRLWKELRDLSPARVPVFGDYGVQHPKRPKGGGGRGMRANIRYSTPEAVLIARGRRLDEEGAIEYQRLCELLMKHPAFKDGGYSWGDHLITRCGSGWDEPGSQRKWRGVGTSHHIQVMVDELAWPSGIAQPQVVAEPAISVPPDVLDVSNARQPIQLR